MSAARGARAGTGLWRTGAILLLGLGLRLDYAWEGREPVYDAVAYEQIARQPRARRGLHRGDVGDPALEQLLARAASAGRRPLPAERRRPRAAGPGRAGPDRLALGALHLPDRPPALRAGAGLIGGRAVAIYPALLEYGGMLMSEPLATTLLAGRGAGDALGGRPERAAALGAAGGAARRAGADPPRVPGGRRRCSPSSSSPAGSGARVGAGRWPRPRCCSPGSCSWSRPGRSATLVVLDRFVPISTGGGQVLFAGSYLPSGGDPEQGRPRGARTPPGAGAELAADTSTPGAGTRRGPRPGPGSSRFSRRWPPSATRSGNRQGAGADGTRTPLGRPQRASRSPTQASSPRSSWRVWGHGPREVMRRPVWELLHGRCSPSASSGSAVLIAARRWEVVPILTVLLAITAIEPAPGRDAAAGAGRCCRSPPPSPGSAVGRLRG